MTGQRGARCGTRRTPRQVMWCVVVCAVACVVGCSTVVDGHLAQNPALGGALDRVVAVPQPPHPPKDDVIAEKYWPFFHEEPDSGAYGTPVWDVEKMWKKTELPCHAARPYTNDFDDPFDILDGHRASWWLTGDDVIGRMRYKLYPIPNGVPGGQRYVRSRLALIYLLVENWHKEVGRYYRR